MAADISDVGTVRDASRRGVGIRSEANWLRVLAIGAGMSWAIAFVVIGLRYELQMYADGSMFSYAVAVQDVWAFHWHNISGRLFVYLFSLLPAEVYVGLTGDARGGIAAYGFLFFVAPLLGLGATFLADRSENRIIFSYACASTACLCPLVFGFPTEMWMAHALFWPTLAICHYAPAGKLGSALVFVALLVLAFTHAGAVIFTLAILASLLLRGARDVAFLRAAAAFAVVLAIWTAVKELFPPDDYFAPVRLRAALHVFDLKICTGRLMLLLSATLTSYAAAFHLLRRIGVVRADICAAAIVAIGLVLYWVCFNNPVHAENRYYLRTILVVMTPALGLVAAAYALAAGGALNRPVPLLPRVMTALAGGAAIQAAAGALVLVALVHAVETAKFVTAWTDYKTALRTLATGAPSDPELGNPRFVSSQRIHRDLNRMAWFSTTPYLSVLVAPNFMPARLVVDPKSNYFWLSCDTATENFAARRAVPVESRRLVRTYSCLHRR